MKKLCLGLIISLFFIGKALSQEIIYDFDVKRGLEIMGSEERPRVIFFIPELKMPLEKKEINKRFILKDNLIEKDFESFIKEEWQND